MGDNTAADKIRARHYDCFFEDWPSKPWTPWRCAAFAGGGVHLTRCKRKSGYGLEGLFCRQHEDDGVAEILDAIADPKNFDIFKDMADAEAGVPDDIRRELMDCAVSNGRISYAWLLGLYKRGKDAGAAESQSKVAALDGVLAMTVHRLGGIVEGRPTERVNFLQRIDELISKESQLEDMLRLRAKWLHGDMACGKCALLGAIGPCDEHGPEAL